MGNNVSPMKPWTPGFCLSQWKISQSQHLKSSDEKILEHWGFYLMSHLLILIRFSSSHWITTPMSQNQLMKEALNSSLSTTCVKTFCFRRPLMTDYCAFLSPFFSFSLLLKYFNIASKNSNNGKKQSSKTLWPVEVSAYTIHPPIIPCKLKCNVDNEWYQFNTDHTGWVAGKWKALLEYSFPPPFRMLENLELQLLASIWLFML